MRNQTSGGARLAVPLQHRRRAMSPQDSRRPTYINGAGTHVELTQSWSMQQSRVDPQTAPCVPQQVLLPLPWLVPQV